MLAENHIEVRHLVSSKSKESLVLFFNGKNTGVGWKSITLKEMGEMLQECQDDFKLLDIIEEFRTLTQDFLIENAAYLTKSELKEATDKFMEYFNNYTIKR